MFERQQDEQFVKWSKSVKDRDSYTCQVCKAYGVPLNSHHKNSWDLFVDQRYLLENGVTLCVYDHDLFHSIFGKGKNTVYQFKQFLKSYTIFKNALLNVKSSNV